MALGTEVGDAYISVHANTSPYRGELQALRKFNKKQMGKIDKDLELEGANTGSRRIRDMKQALAETSSEGRKMTQQSSKWISPKMLDRAKVADKRLLDLQNKIAKLSKSDLGDENLLGSLEEDTRKAVGGVADLNKEMDTASKTAKDKYAKNVEEADHRTLDLTYRTKDLRSGLQDLRRGFKEVGDEKGIETVDARLKGLEETTRKQKHSLVGLEKGTDEYNDVLKSSTRSIGAHETNTKKLNNTLAGSRDEYGRLREVKQQQVDLDKEIGRAHTNAMRDNKEFDAALKRRGQGLENNAKKMRGLRSDINKTRKSTGRLGDLMGNVGGKVSKSWARMDNTVKLVLTTILAAAGPASAGIAGLAAALTAVVSAAAYAVGALLPLVGLLAPLGLGIGLAVSGLKDLKQYSPEAAAAFGKLGDAFKNIGVKTFMDEWSTSLGKFASKLTSSLDFGPLAEGVGGAFAQITEAFSTVLGGTAWSGFIEAVQGPLSEALGNFGSALAPLAETLMAFLTASAPLVQLMSEEFLKWAEGVKAAFGESVATGEFSAFLDQAKSSLDAVFDLFGSIKGLLGTVFKAGAESGTNFITMMADFFTKWDEFFQTIEGQKALEQWFKNGETIMASLMPLLGSVAQMFADLVTPQTIASMTQFMDTMAEVMPIVGEILAVISELGIINIIADAFKIMADAIKPVLPAFKTLATVLGGALSEAMKSLAPIIEMIAVFIGDLVVAITPIIGTIGNAFVEIFAALAPVVKQVLDAIAPLIPMLSGFLIQAIKTLVPIIVELATVFGEVLGSLITILMPVIEALLPIILSLVPVIVKLFVAFNPVLNVITNLLPVIMPLIELIAKLVVWVLELIAPLIELLVPVLEIIVQFFAFNKAIGSVIKFLAPLIKWFKRIPKALNDVKGALQVAGEFMAKFGAKIAQFVRAAVAVFLRLVNSVRGFFTKGGTAIKEGVTKFLGFFSKLWDDIIAGVTAFAARFLLPIANFVSKVATAVKDFVLKIVSAFVGLWTRIIETVVGFVTKFVGKIVEFAVKVGNKVKDFVLKIVDAYIGLWKRIVETVVGFVTKFVGKIVGFVTKVVGKIRDFATNLVGKFVEIKDRIVAKIVALVEAVKSKIRGMVTSVIDKVKSFMTNIVAKFNDIKTKVTDKVKSMVDKVVQFFKDIPTKIGSAFSGLANAIKAPFKTAFNAVAGFWNRTIGNLKFDIPDWVPGIGGKGFSLPKLPLLASGALLNGPTLNIAGEDGAEAVVPLDRALSRVAPEVRTLSAIAQGKEVPGDTNSRSITIEAGAIVVSAPESDVALVAESVLDRIVAYAT